MKKERVKTDILDRLPDPIGRPLLRLYESEEGRKQFEGLKEIRLRAGQPICLISEKDTFFLDERPVPKMLQDALQALCRNSVYAFERSIREGFVTVSGGYRIGLAGRYMTGKGIVDVGSLNIRIAGEIKGCANGILPCIRKGRRDIYNTLILSPPCCGKTTMLRDMARSLSRAGFRVGVVDERSEIAGAYQGVPSNDLGPNCDIYDTCPKSTGIYMMLRAMSPDVIVTDEIGGDRDIEALRQASRAGIRLVAACHGAGEEDLADGGLRHIFQKIVVLSSREGPGTVERIV